MFSTKRHATYWWSARKTIICRRFATGIDLHNHGSPIGCCWQNIAMKMERADFNPSPAAGRSFFSAVAPDWRRLFAPFPHTSNLRIRLDIFGDFLINFSRQFCLMQHSRCQLLDGFTGCIKIGNSFLAHQCFSFPHFIFAILERCILAARFAFIAYLV